MNILLRDECLNHTWHYIISRGQKYTRIWSWINFFCFRKLTSIVLGDHYNFCVIWTIVRMIFFLKLLMKLYKQSFFSKPKRVFCFICKHYCKHIDCMYKLVKNTGVCCAHKVVIIQQWGRSSNFERKWAPIHWRLCMHIWLSFRKLVLSIQRDGRRPGASYKHAIQ